MTLFVKCPKCHKVLRELNPYTRQSSRNVTCPHCGTRVSYSHDGAKIKMKIF